MGRRSTFRITSLFLATVLLSLGAVPGASVDELFPAVARALQSGDRGRLLSLFPSDRKVSVSLRRIADLEGFAGSGPLVEALRRYVLRRDDVAFERDPSCKSRAGAPSINVRGTLVSRDKAGKRDRVTLVFVFERIGESWLATEVRETG